MERKYGAAIRSFRKYRNMTQKELAQKTGIAEITIRQYEKDKYQPKFDKIKRIAQALDVPTYYFTMAGDTGDGGPDKYEKRWESIADAIMMGTEPGKERMEALQAALNEFMSGHVGISLESTSDEKKELYYCALSKLERLNVAGLSEANSHLDLLVKIKEYLDK